MLVVPQQDIGIMIQAGMGLEFSLSLIVIEILKNMCLDTMTVEGNMLVDILNTAELKWHVDTTMNQLIINQLIIDPVHL